MGAQQLADVSNVTTWPNSDCRKVRVSPGLIFICLLGVDAMELAPVSSFDIDGFWAIPKMVDSGFSMILRVSFKKEWGVRYRKGRNVDDLKPGCLSAYILTPVPVI